MNTLQELIVTVRGLRKDLGVPEKEAAPILLHAENRVLALADANADMLAKMARVEKVEFAEGPLTDGNPRSTARFYVAVTYGRQLDLAPHPNRLPQDSPHHLK